jgi:hypothetical protein
MNRKIKKKTTPNTDSPNPPDSPVCYMDQFPKYFDGGDEEKTDQKPTNTNSVKT